MFYLHLLIGLISTNKYYRVAKNLVLVLNSEAASRDVLKRAVLKNFAIFTEKHLCWSLLLIKLQGSRAATFLKTDYNTGVFL